MVDRFNKLTPAEDERLSILAEECAEVIQIIMKIKRHGYESHHPELTTTNREHLAKEIGDLLSAYQRLILNNDISIYEVSKAAIEKDESILQYLHHNDR